jgi:putative transposon-encoded protein
MSVSVSEKKTVAEEPMEIRMTGYEVVEKMAKPCATSARILVPRGWIGKRVRAVRLDP